MMRKTIIVPQNAFFLFLMRLSHLKGQCHEIFDHFLCLKDSYWDPNEQAKTVSRTLSFSRRYSIAKFENCVSA